MAGQCCKNLGVLISLQDDARGKTTEQMKLDSKITVKVFEKWHSHKLMKKYLLVKYFLQLFFPIFLTYFSTVQHCI